MYWGVVAQAIFFLSLALLATVITIFVFAASLLGRAVEAKASDEKELRNKREQELGLKVATAKKEFERLKISGKEDDFNVDKALTALKNAQKSKDEFDKKSNVLQKEYKVFTVWGAVSYPAICFLLSITLSALAWSLATTGFCIDTRWFQSEPYQIGLVIASLLPIVIGINRLLFSLKKIQQVAITSEEATLRRTIEAFKIAQRELESENKPMLQLLITEPKQPIRMTRGSEVVLKYEVSLIHGQIAEHAQIFVKVPKGFDFLGEVETYPWNNIETGFKDYIGTSQEILGPVIRGVVVPLELKIKVPPTTGKFQLLCNVVCKDYKGDLKKVGIEVI